MGRCKELLLKSPTIHSNSTLSDRCPQRFDLIFFICKNSLYYPDLFFQRLGTITWLVWIHRPQFYHPGVSWCDFFESCAKYSHTDEIKMSDLINNILENFANFETSGESLPKRSHLLLKCIGCLSLLISVLLWSKNSIYLAWVPCKHQTKKVL